MYKMFVCDEWSLTTGLLLHKDHSFFTNSG